ncbi:hypothetical protein Tco_0776369 [Tanacetum coccineum]
MSNTREAPSSSSKQQTVPHSEQPVEDVPIPDDMNISDSEDTDTTHIPKIKTRPDWLKPVTEEDRPASPEPLGQCTCQLRMIYRKLRTIGAMHLPAQEAEQSRLRRPGFQGGLTISRQQIFFSSRWRVSLAAHLSRCLSLNLEGVEYLVSGDKGRRSALSISKLKTAQYLDFRLEELVPSLWIESEREFDIIRSHMRILSVVSPKTYERYGYTFLKEIVLRRADYKEYKISEIDFKNLHPNDFEDMYLGVHKFCDGTLTRILERLDHMVKDFRLFRYNSGMESRIWFEDDKRRSKEFIEMIERRLKIRNIFRNLESFVSGRLRDVDYRLITRTK